jgi:hypothetical protein
VLKDGSVASAVRSRAKTPSHLKESRKQANKKDRGQKPVRTKQVPEKQPRTTLRMWYRMKRAA